MAFLDDLKDKTIDIAQAGVTKSMQLMEIAKLNMTNASEEEAIKKAYAELGKLYYAERGLAPEAAYVALCEKITQSKTTIEENKARLAELKRQGDVKDAEVSAVVQDVPPEEPADSCDGGCCCVEEAPAEEAAPAAEETPVVDAEPVTEENPGDGQ